MSWDLSSIDNPTNLLNQESSYFGMKLLNLNCISERNIPNFLLIEGMSFFFNENVSIWSGSYADESPSDKDTRFVPFHF